MDFRLVFEPTPKPDTEAIPAASVYEAIYVNESEMPNWKKSKIAMFSVGADKSYAQSIRMSFYKLYRGYSGDYIVDLGVLKNGIDEEETQDRIKEVCSELLLNNTIPLIIGDKHALDYGQYMGYEVLEKDVNLLVADSRIDLLDSTDSELQHTKKIVLHVPNYLFNYSHIGYQSYLNAPEAFETLEKLNFDRIRIGQVHKGIELLEPYIRFANMVSLDLSVVRDSDAPGKKDSFPFGMTAEQFCQMCWYAGLSNACSSIGFYGYDPELDDREVTAKLVAVAIWYFVEGISEREEKHEFESEFYRKYIVSMENLPDLIFYKSRIKEFWWVKIEGRIFPCNYSDYQESTTGELPAVYNRFLEKNV